jgi:cyanophycinase
VIPLKEIGSATSAVGLAVVVICLFAAVAPASAAGDAPAVAVPSEDCDGSGSLVIVGGAWAPENEPVHDRTIELGGGTERANIVIVPAASSTPAQSGEAFVEDFVEYGVPEENVSLVPIASADDPSTPANESRWADNVDDPDVVDRIEAATVVVFPGGSQLRLRSVLAPDGERSPAMAAIDQTYRDCGVIAGTSAGAAVMSDPMIGSGASYGALYDGVAETDTFGEADDNRVWLTPGFGYLDHAIVDQHFQERGRIGRLLRAVVEAPDVETGYGIGENTALVFSAGRSEATVLGEGGVTILQTERADTIAADPGGSLTLDNATVHYLTDGDRYDTRFGTVSVAPEKQPIETPYFGPVETPIYRVFENPATVSMLTDRLVDSESTSVTALECGDGRSMFASGDRGVELAYVEHPWTMGWIDTTGESWQYSVVGADLSIRPVHCR